MRKDGAMSELATLSAMAEAARFAAGLMPVNLAPGQFGTWDDFKAAFDLVDRPLTAAVGDRLAAARPGVPWADEIDTELPDGEAWVVDAVDGAIQYLQGLPQWSVSVALVRGGQPVLAALYSPFLGELYTAARGHGAFRDGVRVTPSVKTDLGLALAGTSQPPFPARQPAAVTTTGRAMTLLLPAVGAVRNLGPTSWQVADVASGRLDVFWEYGRDAGNLLAGSLLVTEAGGVVTDADGKPWDARSASFVAGPAALHAQVIDLLADVR
jgi:myo-inositol-1(or 4)-monophosphatase